MINQEEKYNSYGGSGAGDNRGLQFEASLGKD
jgi:hypothetical protein